MTKKPIDDPAERAFMEALVADANESLKVWDENRESYKRIIAERDIVYGIWNDPKFYYGIQYQIIKGGARIGLHDKAMKNSQLGGIAFPVLHGAKFAVLGLPDAFEWLGFCGKYGDMANTGRVLLTMQRLASGGQAIIVPPGYEPAPGTPAFPKDGTLVTFEDGQELPIAAPNAGMFAPDPAPREKGKARARAKTGHKARTKGRKP